MKYNVPHTLLYVLTEQANLQEILGKINLSSI